VTDDLDDNDLPPPPAVQSDATAQRLAAVEAQLELASIKATIGVDDAAAEKIRGIAHASRISHQEAAAVLATRDPAAMGMREISDLTYGSLTPRWHGPTPKVDDATRRKQYVASLKGQNEALRARYLDNQAGAYLAEAMGWTHALLPLPQE